ncbi:MAG: endolytic transglycosylase MltG, partial [Pseudomonadota bacterium]
MWRSLASNALSLLAVALFLAGGVILWGRTQYQEAGPLTDAMCLLVDRGSTMRRVSLDLEEQGAIANGSIFRIGADYEEKSSQLKAGSFLLEPGASMAEIVDQITRGGPSTCGTEVVFRIGVNRVSTLVRELDPATNRFVEVMNFDPAGDDVPAEYATARDQAGTRFRVALAEGVTSWQVATALGQIDVLGGEVSELPPEGALAPDSYEVATGDERDAVIARMLQQQEEWVAEAWEARDPDVPLQSPEELLTLASIIEKETGVPDERGQVASVFVNRLNAGRVGLQT